MAARALSGLRDLAPGSSPFAGPASAAPPGNIADTVPRLWRMAARALSGLRDWAAGSSLRRPGKRSAAGQSGRVPVFVQDGG